MSNWEDRDYSWLENEDAGDAASDSEEDIESLSQYEYSQRLFDLLVELKLSQRLSANTVCTIAFWAKGAGVGEPASLLALSPKTHWRWAIGTFRPSHRSQGRIESWFLQIEGANTFLSV